LTFTGVDRDERGEVLRVESFAPERGQGPPLHVHHLQEEAITVQEGQLVWQGQDGAERRAKAGETVGFAPGEAHKFWNAGHAPLRLTGELRPPGNFEYFLTEIYASTARNGGRRPGLFDAAFLTTRFRSEFEMLEIPGPVRKVLVPVLYRLGRALGRHERFAGAPEPVTDGTAGRSRDQST